MRRPMSLNGYSWVEGNPVMNTDPSGFSHVHIWASAFIMPEQIEFPYVDPFSGYDDFSAIWKGDGREFYSGGPVPDNNARVYFNVEFDWTNLSNNLTNDAGTNVTEVTHRPWATLGMPVTEFKKAPDPSVATINCDEVHGYSVVYVEFEADGDSGKNPLVPFAPAIEMHYRIWIAPRGVVRIMRTIDRYPWHELFIEIDGIPVVELREEPPGPTITPLDLALEGDFDDVHISFEGGSDERCSDTLSLCQRLQLEDSCCNLP